MRKDHIANQTSHQGLSTTKNGYDFATLAQLDSVHSNMIQKPSGADFWQWLKTANFKLAA